MRVARLAQSVEHQTFNLRVMGSSPISGDNMFLFFKLFEFSKHFFLVFGSQMINVKCQAKYQGTGMWKPICWIMFVVEPFLCSLRNRPLLLALRRWGRLARRNVRDSATEDQCLHNISDSHGVPLKRGGGDSWEFLVGVCRPVPPILTRFQTKKCKFSYRFHTWPLG